MNVDSGQFIGFRAKSWSSDVSRNMFASYRSQWPDCCQSFLSTRIGVLISW